MHNARRQGLIVVRLPGVSDFLGDSVADVFVGDNLRPAVGQRHAVGAEDVLSVPLLLVTKLCACKLVVDAILESVGGVGAQVVVGQLLGGGEGGQQQQGEPPGLGGSLVD